MKHLSLFLRILLSANQDCLLFTIFYQPSETQFVVSVYFFTKVIMKAIRNLYDKLKIIGGLMFIRNH